jgi:endonuclease/exonuclease/phosphatase family metal-dependent hydrolase
LLSSRPSGRRPDPSSPRRLRRLVSVLSRARELVLMGDLNMEPVRAARASRLRALAVGSTYPADAPREQLDHVLGRGDLGRVVAGGPRLLPLSDHCALTVDLASGG